jgi:hypothetical protein
MYEEALEKLAAERERGMTRRHSQEHGTHRTSSARHVYGSPRILTTVPGKAPDESGVTLAD